MFQSVFNFFRFIERFGCWNQFLSMNRKKLCVQARCAIEPTPNMLPDKTSDNQPHIYRTRRTKRPKSTQFKRAALVQTRPETPHPRKPALQRGLDGARQVLEGLVRGDLRMLGLDGDGAAEQKACLRRLDHP